MRIPKKTPNNQDAFVWALHLLGGANRPVDVEDIYLKCFELAPARLGWRTHPEIPDYKKVSKALQSVEATTHTGLIHKVDMYHRQLTTAGSAWVELHKSLLQSVYGGEHPVEASNRSPHERLRRQVQSSSAFRSERPSLHEIAEGLACSPTSPKSVWNSRLIALERAAVVLESDALIKFFNRITMILNDEGVL